MFNQRSHLAITFTFAKFPTVGSGILIKANHFTFSCNFPSICTLHQGFKNKTPHKGCKNKTPDNHCIVSYTASNGNVYQVIYLVGSLASTG